MSKGNKTPTVKELRAEEKRLFDTYKQNRRDEDKADHLERMAKVIRQIIAIEKK